jgi:hypothetical protein
MQNSFGQRDALFWCLALKGQDTPIGACTLWNFDADFYCAELGYELNPAYHQPPTRPHGWSVACRAEYGFNELGMHRIEASPLAANISSKNLLLKLGFSYKGNLRKRHFFRGQFEDQLYFGLLREEWLNQGHWFFTGDNRSEPTVSDRRIRTGIRIFAVSNICSKGSRRSVSMERKPSSTAASNASLSGNSSFSNHDRTSRRSAGVSFGRASKISWMLIVLPGFYSISADKSNKI